MIRCNNLTKQFGNITAIENFTVSIPDGVIFGLLGPNGAGKTTTMRLMSCLLRPTKGTVQIDEYAAEQDAMKIRQMIGLLPEVPGLYETLGAYKNLEYYAQLYGIEKQKREETIKSLLSNLGLWDRRNEPVSGFSKGMKQKIAIARALVHEPRYLFLDEPTASLDPEAAKTVREYIIQLKSQGKTIVINTHNLSEAERICDTVAFVKNRVIEVGNPKRLAQGLFSRTVRVTTTAKLTDSLRAKIQNINGIRFDAVSGNTLVFTVQNPEEENPRIIEALQRYGIPIVFIAEEEPSLEDVYLKLIKEDGQ
ncbi:MAG: ABC transporter ATP-binding protein [Candidatus Thermoplasmatota archaeon]